MSFKVDLTGKTINDWTFLQFIGNDSHGASRWRVKCACGLEQINVGQNITSGLSRRCKNCATARSRKPAIDGVPHHLWRIITKNANKRNIELSVTPKQAYAQYVNQKGLCALSGIPIAFSSCVKEHYKGLTTASYDRLDCLFGYTLDNTQWVHKNINRAKNVMSDEDFVLMCCRVAERAKLRYTSCQ